MNKKHFCMAACAFALAAAAKLALDACKKDETDRDGEISELISSVKSVLKDNSVTDFTEFTIYLDEYYNICAIRGYDDNIIYSSPRFSEPINSFEIMDYCRLQEIPYDICDFENYFSAKTNAVIID